MNTEQRLGMASISSILELLVDKAQEKLTPQDSEWLADGIDEIAYLESYNLQKVVVGIAGLVHADTIAGNFKDNDSVAGLLYSIAHQLDAINGLLRMKTSIEVYDIQKQGRNLEQSETLK